MAVMLGYFNCNNSEGDSQEMAMIIGLMVKIFNVIQL